MRPLVDLLAIVHGGFPASVACTSPMASFGAGVAFMYRRSSRRGGERRGWGAAEWSALAAVVATLIPVLTYFRGSEKPRPGDWKPRLVVPRDGSTVSQPFLQPWLFNWDEPSGPNTVSEYNLRVF